MARPLAMDEWPAGAFGAKRTADGNCARLAAVSRLSHSALGVVGDVGKYFLGRTTETRSEARCKYGW
eukprot:CAMPEP_0174702444 /NCGR_PEP_ID=MMETSP1094-20130205/6730_1 /TAXON_ID=156173 /ORGANISM="Chrysochromulina brevifilum, Strain UTEX LB 985" /LENGTH=66 /DNA_ID=CAMNT_0015900221 /DNA_START=71 /DNA_END=271 /DNA_ORIENTATION=+